jgi:outer membrane protein assembly factor BamB
MKPRGSLLAGLAVGALGVAWFLLARDATEPAPKPEPVTLPAQADNEFEGPGEVQTTREAGRFRRMKPTGAQVEIATDLEAIGYASGSEEAPEATAVTRHDRARALQGTNLYTSGHAPVAVLIDMDGKELHTWRADVRALWPEERLEGRNLALVQFWRRAFLREDGALLAIFEGHSLVKLDKDSNVLWKSRNRAHHDLEVLANGDILVLTREAHVVPEYNAKRPILEDYVTLLDANGVEKRRVSLLEALEASPHADLKQRAHQRRDDILHTNTLHVLDGRLADRIPAFRACNVLVSSRPLSFLAVLDLEREELVWTLEGSFREQHDPQILANGNLLLLDNTGLGEASRVLELDPASGATVWEYRGTEADPFFTRTCGTAQRLANGNTLVTESDSGRAFEVAADGTLVWEFWNPARVHENGEVYIATLFELVRLGPETPLDWLGPR